jgi:hypothetical protein
VQNNHHEIAGRRGCRLYQGFPIEKSGKTKCEFRVFPIAARLARGVEFSEKALRKPAPEDAVKTLLLVVLLALPTVLHAETSFGPAYAPVGADFLGVRFGQAPSEDMVCTRGPCAEARRSLDHNSRVRILTSYKRAVDSSFLGPVEIASPRYDFFEDRLVRVMFRIECEKDSAAACVSSVLTSLGSGAELILLEKIVRQASAADQPIRQSIYRLQPGIVVMVDYPGRNDRWESPLVQIYDEHLMEKLRRAANPNYGH